VKISREIKVGILFLVGLAFLIWGYNFLKGKNIFKKERVFYAVYNEIDGLTKSNIISIQGLLLN